MLLFALLTNLAPVLGQAAKNGTATNGTASAVTNGLGSDCRAPTIYNACMERGQQMLDKCAGDSVCNCRFSRALTLCFEQCKSANPAQKQQIDAGSEAACSKLSPEQKSAAFSQVAPTSSSTASFPTGTTGVAAKVNAASKGSQSNSQSSNVPSESTSDGSLPSLSPFALAYLAYNFIY